jgi:predicted GNAT family N-acyltransferase
MSRKYTFREISKKEELERFFRLRYKVYSECRWSCVLNKTNSHIDIDYFDLHSRHFALVSNNIDIGYFRIVLPKEELVQNSVIEVGRKYQFLNNYKNYLCNSAESFPFIGYNKAPEASKDFYNKIQKNNQSLVEASRLIVKKEFRNIRTTKFLIECAIVLFIIICLGKKYGVITCHSSHVRFYKHYGFKIIGKNEKFELLKQKRIAMSLLNLPIEVQLKLEDMTDEYKKTGKIERIF